MESVLSSIVTLITALGSEGRLEQSRGGVFDEGREELTQPDFISRVPFVKV